jgi:hypothetical protein
MEKVTYRWHMVILVVTLMLAPLHHTHAAVKQFTDAHGTIYISNIHEAKADLPAGDPNPALQPNHEVVSLQEPTPSNIFPEPGEASASSSTPDHQATAPGS